MNIDFQILGIPECKRAFKNMAEKVQRKIMRQATDKAVKNILLPEVISRAPFKTGALVASLINVKSKKRGFVGANVSTRGKPGIADRAFHAGPVEYGTKHSQAQPYLRPALDAVATDLLQSVAEDVARDIESAGKE